MANDEVTTPYNIFQDPNELASVAAARARHSHPAAPDRRSHRNSDTSTVRPTTFSTSANLASGSKERHQNREPDVPSARPDSHAPTVPRSRGLVPALKKTAQSQRQQKRTDVQPNTKDDVLDQADRGPHKEEVPHGPSQDQAVDAANLNSNDIEHENVSTLGDMFWELLALAMRIVRFLHRQWRVVLFLTVVTTCFPWLVSSSCNNPFLLVPYISAFAGSRVSPGWDFCDGFRRTENTIFDHQSKRKMSMPDRTLKSFEDFRTLARLAPNITESKTKIDFAYSRMAEVEVQLTYAPDMFGNAEMQAQTQASLELLSRQQHTMNDFCPELRAYASSGKHNMAELRGKMREAQVGPATQLPGFVRRLVFDHFPSIYSYSDAWALQSQIRAFLDVFIKETRRLGDTVRQLRDEAFAVVNATSALDATFRKAGERWEQECQSGWPPRPALFIFSFSRAREDSDSAIPSACRAARPAQLQALLNGLRDRAQEVHKTMDEVWQSSSQLLTHLLEIKALVDGSSVRANRTRALSPRPWVEDEGGFMPLTEMLLPLLDEVLAV